MTQCAESAERNHVRQTPGAIRLAAIKTGHSRINRNYEPERPLLKGREKNGEENMTCEVGTASWKDPTLIAMSS
jgi:hypothetical protein